MGVLGGALGGFLGGELAGAVSDAVHGSCRGLKGKKHHKCRKNKQKSRDLSKGVGSAAGGVAGTVFEPFKNGGPVKGKRGAPRKAIVHGGEYVLPVGVKRRRRSARPWPHARRRPSQERKSPDRLSVVRRRKNNYMVLVYNVVL